MLLRDIEQSHIAVDMHWTEARLIAAAFREAKEHLLHFATVDQLDTYAMAFEAAALAGFAHGRVVDVDLFSLATMRDAPTVKTSPF